MYARAFLAHVYVLARHIYDLSDQTPQLYSARACLLCSTTARATLREEEKKNELKKLPRLPLLYAYNVYYTIIYYACVYVWCLSALSDETHAPGTFEQRTAAVPG